MFYCEFWKISKNSFFIKHLRATASEILLEQNLFSVRLHAEFQNTKSKATIGKHMYFPNFFSEIVLIRQRFNQYVWLAVGKCVSLLSLYFLFYLSIFNLIKKIYFA